MSFPVKHITTTIKRSARDVYAFASNPANLPQWAAGLSGSTISRSGDEWISESPMGKVKVKFAEKNLFGVMDHDVTLPSGEVNHNPFRVMPNGEQSEIVFTLFHLPRMSASEFEKDAGLVATDLKKLKATLEKTM